MIVRFVLQKRDQLRLLIEPRLTIWQLRPVAPQMDDIDVVASIEDDNLTGLGDEVSHQVVVPLGRDSVQLFFIWSLKETTFVKILIYVLFSIEFVSISTIYI